MIEQIYQHILDKICNKNMFEAIIFQDMKSFEEFFGKKLVTVMKWPPLSPDLNSIKKGKGLALKKSY